MRSGITYLAVCLVAIAALATSCRKQRTEEGTVPVLDPAGTNITKDLSNLSLSETQQALDGKWYLLSSSGGFAGDYKKHSGICHIFGKSTFTINDNGSVTTHPCTWEKVKSIHSTKDVHQLNYKGSLGISFLRIKNDTLYTSDNVYDGYGSEYVKIK